MGNKMIVYDKHYYAVMANDIVKGKQEMTLMEARIIRLLITQVVKQDPELKTYTCRIQDLADFLNIPSNNLYRDIKNICESLLKRLVRVGTKNPKEPWISFQWIQLAKYDGNGNITLKLSEQIAPYVLELNAWFTQYQLENILGFNSFYAIRIYEILKCDNGITRDEQGEFTYTIENLRKILCCEDKFNKITDFTEKVIDTAVREINDKSDILVSYELKKTSRKFTDIIFTVGINGRNYIKRKNASLQA